MSEQNTFHCIVDDTTLTTNLDEIGPWVQNGDVNLVVPLYTLERLHLLKKDASQLGNSARKAVKLLDQCADLPHSPVSIQGFEDQYVDWSQVEKHYALSVIQRDESGAEADGEKVTMDQSDAPLHSTPKVAMEKQMQDLSLSSDDLKSSPVSTPPLSPTTSDPQSTKTSPEIKCSTVNKREATPVPPTLKPLINYVVWYTHENPSSEKLPNVVFLTNSADAAQIAKDFGVLPKTIHQLRASISSTADSVTNTQNQHKKKSSGRAMSFKNDAEHRTLFRYEEGSSEEEELIFKPRPREPARPSSSGRGNNGASRGRGAFHSPSNSLTSPVLPKPQIPVEEIDPDSFDRGTFARGSTPLANVGNTYGPSNSNNNNNNNLSRGGHRNFNNSMQRGHGFRGNTFRGRGRGRLYVP